MRRKLHIYRDDIMERIGLLNSLNEMNINFTLKKGRKENQSSPLYTIIRPDSCPLGMGINCYGGISGTFLIKTMTPFEFRIQSSIIANKRAEQTDDGESH